MASHLDPSSSSSPGTKLKVPMKSDKSQGDEMRAIKKSPDDVPEGKSTILNSSLCNEGFRIASEAILERPAVKKVSMKRKGREYEGTTWSYR